jgi:hypothetical protein
VSLVNDMLRDLNKRTPVSNKAARVHGALQSSIDSKRPKIRMGLILGGGLLAGLLGGYLYFESMGVQVVQVPLAVVPSAPQASAPVTQNIAPVTATEAPAETAAAADANANTPAVEILVEIRELALQPNGFTLLVEASQETAFEIRDRSAFGLTLHLDGVDRYDRSGTTVPGMSMMLVSDGLDIGIELDQSADFLVTEDAETPAFDILITVSYHPEELTAVPQEQSTELPASASIPAPQTGLASSTSERSTPTRINRELSLDDRDRNNSQEALRMAQSGRMVDAYRQLLAFLEENPAGHQSRETLAKLLLAQQEFAQANTIVDQGLAEVPNYGPFKKIKARLLMRDNDPAQALALLRNVPPSVAADTEYHELLASLYQQGNYHSEAVTAYQELLRFDRNQGRWWIGLGISLDAQDQDSDALVSYQTALQTQDLDTKLRQFIQGRISNLGIPQ